MGCNPIWRTNKWCDVTVGKHYTFTCINTICHLCLTLKNLSQSRVICCNDCVIRDLPAKGGDSPAATDFTDIDTGTYQRMGATGPAAMDFTDIDTGSHDLPANGGDSPAATDFTDIDTGTYQRMGVTALQPRTSPT